MKKLIIIFLCLTAISASAQKIENVKSHQNGENIEITYDITEAKSGQKFIVTICCSTDGGKTYGNTLNSVTGDVGDNITSGNNKKIIWNVLKDTIILQSKNVVFLVKAYTNEPRSSFFAGYKGSSCCPIGLQLGTMGNFGGYIGFNTNTNNEFSISGGLTKRITKFAQDYNNLHLTTGIGYGHWAYNYSIGGYELPAMGSALVGEIGAIINFDNINLNLGYLLRSKIFNSNGVKLNNTITFGLGFTI